MWCGLAFANVFENCSIQLSFCPCNLFNKALCLLIFVLHYCFYSASGFFMHKLEIFLLLQALGDYTKMIKDFSVLPSQVREGRLGSYWYHEDTQAFFDDADHYKMIKAMCKLSCSECDKLEEQSNESSKRRPRFRNIEQLKGHLYHQHRLSMCPLCLEARKVKFIYMRAWDLGFI